jgi:hypothetical protein
MVVNVLCRPLARRRGVLHRILTRRRLIQFWRCLMRSLRASGLYRGRHMDLLAMWLGTDMEAVTRRAATTVYGAVRQVHPRRPILAKFITRLQLFNVRVLVLTPEVRTVRQCVYQELVVLQLTRDRVVQGGKWFLGSTALVRAAFCFDVLRAVLLTSGTHQTLIHHEFRPWIERQTFLPCQLQLLFQRHCSLIPR